MSISITSFGGIPGFYARVFFPRFAIKIYSRLQFFLTKKKTFQYINNYPSPIMISIETMSRCNGKCSFCPVNVKEEKRPLKIMEDKLFSKILSDLEKKNYSDILTLFCNNEPFLDKRMPDMLKEARCRLPNAKILMATNGSVLNTQVLNSIASSVDILHINNYNDSYKFTESSKIIYEHVIKNPAIFQDIDIKIERRYVKEVLSNRAGISPNYPHKQNILHYPCIIPFTDLTVYPDGVVGICCNDAHEKTNFGNLNYQSISDVWNDEKILSIKKLIAYDRSNYDFCKYCNFIEAGTRFNYIKQLDRDVTK